VSEGLGRIVHMFDQASGSSPGVSADSPESGVAQTPQPTGSFADVSGVVLAQLLAAPLADLAAIPDSPAGDAALVDVATGLARLEAWSVAQRARVVALLVRRTGDELRRHGLARHGDSHGTTAGRSHAHDDERMAERLVSTDVSLALGVSTFAADRELELAEGLAAHPELGVALAGGRMDRRRAEVVLEEVAPLRDVAVRRRVIASVVGDGTHAADGLVEGDREALVKELRREGQALWHLPAATLRRAVRRQCAGLDPGVFAEREAIARRGRHIEWRSLPDAQCELAITSSACAVAAAHTNIDRAARAARSAGDRRTLEQLRSDISIGWLTEGAFGTLVVRPAASLVPVARTDAVAQAAVDPEVAQEAAGVAGWPSVTLRRPTSVLVVISMPACTGLGLDDQPATLFGPGGPMPIPAAVAREIAHDPEMATWMGLFTDPRTGVATDISPRYRPPPRMRTFVQLRDGLRSRLPSSQVRRIELDHVRPFDRRRSRLGGPGPASSEVSRSEVGGETTAANLASAGLREHHLKTDGVLQVGGDASGPLTYTTHTEHAYLSWPEVWETQPTMVDVGRPIPEQRAGRSEEDIGAGIGHDVGNGSGYGSGSGSGYGSGSGSGYGSGSGDPPF
jgi:hypothetical protein